MRPVQVAQMLVDMAEQEFSVHRIWRAVSPANPKCHIGLCYAEAALSIVASCAGGHVRADARKLLRERFS